MGLLALLTLAGKGPICCPLTPVRIRTAYIDEVARGSRQVKRGGGKIHHNALFAQMIAADQRRRSVCGGVGEIGVHHGHFFIALAHTACACDSMFAADVFGAQHLNVDHSGRGDKAKFLSNIAKFGLNSSLITLFEGSSLNLRKPPWQLRLLSIDGGHTDRITTNDLVWFLENAHPTGVAILDDYDNSGWPDVKTAVDRLIREGKVFPFLYVGPDHSKLFVASTMHAAAHYSELLAAYAVSSPQLNNSAIPTLQVAGISIHKVLQTGDARAPLVRWAKEWKGWVQHRDMVC